MSKRAVAPKTPAPSSPSRAPAQARAEPAKALDYEAFADEVATKYPKILARLGE